MHDTNMAKEQVFWKQAGGNGSNAAPEDSSGQTITADKWLT